MWQSFFLSRRKQHDYYLCSYTLTSDVKLLKTLTDTRFRYLFAPVTNTTFFILFTFVYKINDVKRLIIYFPFATVSNAVFHTRLYTNGVCTAAMVRLEVMLLTTNHRLPFYNVTSAQSNHALASVRRAQPIVEQYVIVDIC